jgi:hypothetical protein
MTDPLRHQLRQFARADIRSAHTSDKRTRLPASNQSLPRHAGQNIVAPVAPIAAREVGQINEIKQGRCRLRRLAQAEITIKQDLHAKSS